MSLRMKPIRFGFQVLTLSLLCCLSTSMLSAAETVIAYKDCGVTSLSAGDLKKMFLGKKKNWANGKKVVLATLKGGDLHKTFMKERVGKSPGQFKSYWKKLVFTGKGAMPKMFESEDELKAYVAKTEGAIGYIGGEAGGDVVGLAIE